MNIYILNKTILHDRHITTDNFSFITDLLKCIPPISTYLFLTAILAKIILKLEYSYFLKRVVFNGKSSFAKFLIDPNFYYL